MTVAGAEVQQERRGESVEDVLLLRRFATSREPLDRERLVERYLPLARYAANRYHRASEPFDDLVQVASLGLLKAIDRFDPDNGAGFVSYALPTMYGELRRHFRDHSWTVRPPRTLQDHALLVERTGENLLTELGRPPSVDQIAARSGLSVEEVLEAREALAAHRGVSLAATVHGADGVVELGSRLGTDDPEFERADERAVLAGLMRGLSVREREIVRLRMEEDLTQSEIGRRVGLSQMHVSRLLRDALNKLQLAARAQAGSLAEDVSEARSAAAPSGR
jgi:RNA polymerase sigma-B factor